MAGGVLAAALALFCLANSLLLLSSQVPRLFYLDETTWGESYVLYDVLHFQNTGEIYRDLSQPPYLPAQYSPLMYMLYSLPGRVLAFDNPFLGPRAIALSAFLACIAIVVSIVRVLIPARHAWVWGLLLATSIIGFQTWQPWIILARGDLPGTVFSLLALRLLLSRSPHAVPLAGLCAGLSMQFKITFVAAMAAGFLWLLFRKQWRELVSFAAAAIMSSAGPYALFWVREPRMLAQMIALSPGISDLLGALRLSFRELKEPVALLALLALPPIGFRAWSRWTLLFLFALISLAIGGLAAIQAGASLNYFFEGLLVLVPAAVLGVLRLICWARQRAGVAVFLSAIILLHFLPPTALSLYETLWSDSARQQVMRGNRKVRDLEHILAGRHIFSTVPRLALLDPVPAVTEPFLMSYMQQLGKFDPAPIAQRIRDEEFDVVITAARPAAYRGIPKIAPDLRRAIEEAYEPQCTMIGALVHVPRARAGADDLVRELDRNGCMPVHGGGTTAGANW
jgi:hypothetical protein